MPFQNDFSFSKKYISSEAYTQLWTIFARGIGIIGTILIWSSLTPYEYGVFQLFLSAHATLLGLTSLGGSAVGTDVARFFGEQKFSQAKKLWYEYHGLRLTVSTILFVGILLGASLLSVWYKPDFIMMVRLVAILVFVDIISSFIKSFLGLHLALKVIARKSLIYKSVQVAILAGFFFLSDITTPRILLSMIVGSVAASILQSAVLLPLLKDWRKIPTAQEPLLYSVMRTHGKWEILRQFVSKLTSRAQPWLIKIFISTEAVGVYSIATSIIDMIKNLLPIATLPALTVRKLHLASFTQTLYIYGSKYMTASMLALLLLAAPLIPVALIIIAPQHLASLPLIYALMAGALFYPLSTLTETLLIGFREQKYFFYRMITRTVVWFVSALVLLPSLGLAGMVLLDVIIGISIALAGYAQLIRKRPNLTITYEHLTTFTSRDRQILSQLYATFRQMLTVRFAFLRK